MKHPTSTGTPRLVSSLGVYVVRSGADYYAEIVNLDGLELARLGPETSPRDAELEADRWLEKRRAGS